MSAKINKGGDNRRDFLKGMVAYGGVLTLGSYTSELANGRVDAAPLDAGSVQIGIQIGPVREAMMKDPDTTLAKVAEIGFTTFAPSGFSGIDPTKYRAMLDSHRLIASNIDSAISTGADMEKDLESCQIMGIKYAEPYTGGGRGIGGARGTGVREQGGGGRGPIPRVTEESAKQTAADYNKYGEIGKRYGIKIMFHNHVEHFEMLQGSQSTLFDVFLSETDPDTVAMELDIGATAIAGRNIPDVIKKYPGRFPVWDINDAFGIKNADTNPMLTPNQRRVYTYGVPVGLGDVDFRTCFASCALAGMKYAIVNQGNAASWGDSFAAVGVSYQNLVKILA